MSGSEKTIQRLKENIKCLKLQVSAFKNLQKKMDCAERECYNSRKKFKTIFDQSPHGYKYIDANLKILQLNKALIKLLGYSKKELLGSCITDFVVPEYLKNWEELQHELWVNKKPSYSIDTCFINKNKSMVWCHVTTILLEDNGEMLGYTVLENFSDCKMMEMDMMEVSSRELQFEQELLEMTINTQEKERARIAEDLHNGLGQLLYGVKLNLDQIKLDNLALQGQNVQTIEKTKHLLTECIKESRRISHNLMPTVLRDFGIKVAIEEICRQLSRTTNFRCEFAGLDTKIPKYLEKALYRIVQELAMNLIKHADATKASLKLSINKEEILVRVEDNGKGFDASNIKGNDGIGLQSIKNKLHFLKGELDISSTPGNGTIVYIRIPIMLK